jgi:hypothetical protein
MSGSTKGGFHIGTVGGNASFSAGGDMVAGDKVTQTTTTTVKNGFKQDDDKQKFLRIASPEMFPEAEMLPHLICSRPMFIGGAKDEADQHGGA